MPNTAKAVVKTSKVITKAGDKKTAKPAVAASPKARVLVQSTVSNAGPENMVKNSAKTSSKSITTADQSRATVAPEKVSSKSSKKTVLTKPFVNQDADNLKSISVVSSEFQGTASEKTSSVIPDAESSAHAVAEHAFASAPTKSRTSVGHAESLGLKPYIISTEEDYMSETQQAYFKELLHVWRATLSSKIDTAVSHLKDEPKHFADLNDRATQEEEFNLELKARDREADLVADIDEALKRLRDGEYGYCEECGVDIGIRRLEARPTATLCIDCKTLAEMRQKQAGGQ